MHLDRLAHARQRRRHTGNIVEHRFDLDETKGFGRVQRRDDQRIEGGVVGSHLFGVENAEKCPVAAFFIFLDTGHQAVGVGLFAENGLILPCEKHLCIRIFFENGRHGIEQNFDALLGSETRCHANDGTAFSDLVFFGESRDRIITDFG